MCPPSDSPRRLSRPPRADWRSADASNGKLEILLADPWKGQDEVLGEFTAAA